MKRKIRKTALQIIIAVMLAGCGYEPPEEERAEHSSFQETSVEEIQESSQGEEILLPVGFEVYFEDSTEDVLSDEGVLLMEIETNMPVFIFDEEYKQAEGKMNTWFRNRQEAVLAEVEEYKGWAVEHYNYSLSEKLIWTIPYVYQNIYSMVRMDEIYTGVRTDNAGYLGGAHGLISSSTVNFSTETGEILTFADIVTNESEARAQVEEIILEQTQASDITFFENYEESIPEILTDTTWYMTEDRFVVICNVYIISPYVDGIREFSIPLDKFKYLKEKYKV